MLQVSCILDQQKSGWVKELPNFIKICHFSLKVLNFGNVISKEKNIISNRTKARKRKYKKDETTKLCCCLIVYICLREGDVDG